MTLDQAMTELWRSNSEDSLLKSQSLFVNLDRPSREALKQSYLQCAQEQNCSLDRASINNFPKFFSVSITETELTEFLACVALCHYSLDGILNYPPSIREEMIADTGRRIQWSAEKVKTVLLWAKDSNVRAMIDASSKGI